MRLYSLAGATALGAVLAMGGAAHAASPFDGTWRSDMKSAQLPTRPDVMIVKDGMFECRSCTPPYTIKADGAFHPVKDHPSYDEASLKIVDARTVDGVNRKNGREVGRSRTTASADGKTVKVSWTDTTNAGKPPVKGELTETRVGAPAAGEHATSGSWVASKVDAVSQAGLDQTLRLDAAGVLHVTTPTGQSYAAKVDGPAAPYRGDPSITTVTVKRVGERELLETDLYKGKPVGELHMSVSPDGHRLTLHGKNLKSGATFGVDATKV